MIKKLYEYPELVRVEKNEVRYYRDSKENLVPSVTTILSATGDHSGIDAWKRRVGPIAAQAVVEGAGGSVLDTNGDRLIYQKDNILNPHFIVKGNK